MISAQQARNLAMLNIEYDSSYLNRRIIEANFPGGDMTLTIPSDMLTDSDRKSLIKNGYTLTDNEIGETKISWSGNETS